MKFFHKQSPLILAMRQELKNIIDEEGYQERADGYEQAIDFVLSYEMKKEDPS